MWKTVQFSLITRKLDRTEIYDLHLLLGGSNPQVLLLIRSFDYIQVQWNNRVIFHCNVSDVYPCSVNTICNKNYADALKTLKAHDNVKKLATTYD